MSRYQKLESFLFVHRETKKIHVRKTFKKLRIPPLFKSTGEDRVGKARTIALDMIEDHKSKYLGATKGGVSLTFGDLVDKVLRYETTKKRRKTQINHRYYLGVLKDEWSGYVADQITVESWEDWITDFKARKKDCTSFNDYAKHMNLVLRYGYKRKHTSHLVKIPNPDEVKKGTGRVYTEEEITSLWQAMNQDTKDQFLLSYECFMRLREVLLLEWARVDLAEGVITLDAKDVKTGTKTGKGRTFKVSSRSLLMLKRRRKETKGSAYVFPSPGNPNKPIFDNKTAWRTAKRNAGIKGSARWHDLRHTSLTKALLESKVAPILVSEYAGVSLKTIQRVYLHSNEEATKAVAQVIRINTDGVK